MTAEMFTTLIMEAIDNLNVDQARREVEPFVKNSDALIVWSQEFFKEIAGRIQPI